MNRLRFDYLCAQAIGFVDFCVRRLYRSFQLCLAIEVIGAKSCTAAGVA